MDERFAHVQSDPRFRGVPKSVRKVKIDKRFQSLFTDKKFQLKYSVDKRGKPVNQSNIENFKKYYELSSEEDSSGEGSDEEELNDTESKTSASVVPSDRPKQQSSSPKKSQQNKWKVTSSQEEENSIGEENEISDLFIKQDQPCKSDKKSLDLNKADKIEKARMTDEIKVKLRDPQIDFARGVGTLLSDSSSEEESSESDSEDDDVEHHWGELDRGAETTEEVTDRLAVLHMDWDRLRAVDLMVLFNSFLPSEGVIKSVTIYPSEFGLKRMKEEEEKGPPELVNMKPTDEDPDDESKDGRKYHMEKLRQYQLNRLKYYYAVIQFDSPETANKVYSECDGLEYESSATKLDLRVVPEGETFDQEPHEVCSRMPDPAKYEPRIFTNTALQQGKVELTWDETDPSRREFTRKLQKDVDKIDDTDLQAYLASSSGEEEEAEEKNKGDKKGSNDSSEASDYDEKEDDKISKYKSLLASIEEEEEKKKNRDVDLEITWGVGLKEKAEKSIKEKLNAPKTPFEEMLEKRKQNKKLKKEGKLKTKEQEESDESSNISEDDDIPSDVDMNDPFFKEELQRTKSKKKTSVLEKENDEGEDKLREAELELLLMEENDKEVQKSHFNMKQIIDMENDSLTKRKRRKQLKKKQKDVVVEQDDFQVDVRDQRFSALFNSHHFNIDPAEPHFHKTKAMDTIISEKLKRRKVEVESQETSTKQTKLDPELSLLVSSIKSKTKQKRNKPNM